MADSEKETMTTILLMHIQKSVPIHDNFFFFFTCAPLLVTDDDRWLISTSL